MGVDVVARCGEAQRRWLEQARNRLAENSRNTIDIRKAASAVDRAGECKTSGVETGSAWRVKRKKILRGTITLTKGGAGGDG